MLELKNNICWNGYSNITMSPELADKMSALCGYILCTRCSEEAADRWEDSAAAEYYSAAKEWEQEYLTLGGRKSDLKFYKEVM